MKKFSLILTIFIFLIVPPLAIAAPNKPVYATIQEVQQMIADALSPIQSLINNLNTRLGIVESSQTESEQEIANLKNNVATQSAKILELSNRIASLEAKSNEDSKTIVFAQNRPQPFDSPWIEVTGFTTLTVDLNITNYIFNYAIHYTNNPNDGSYTEQLRIDCGGSNACPYRTVPIIGKYYRISTGTADGNVTSTGLLLK